MSRICFGMMSFCLQELPDMTLVLRMINVLIKTIFKIKLVYRRLRYYTFCTRCRNVTDNMKYLKSLNTKIFSANMNFYKEIFSCSVTKFIWAWLNIIFPLLKTEWIFMHDVTKMLVNWNKNVWFMGLIKLRLMQKSLSAFYLGGYLSLLLFSFRGVCFSFIEEMGRTVNYGEYAHMSI